MTYHGHNISVGHWPEDRGPLGPTYRLVIEGPEMLRTARCYGQADGRTKARALIDGRLIGRRQAGSPATLVPGGDVEPHPENFRTWDTADLRIIRARLSQAAGSHHGCSASRLDEIERATLASIDAELKRRQTKG